MVIRQFVDHFNCTEILQILWFKSISWQISSDYKFLKNIPLLNSEETLINPKRTQIENTNLWFITSNKRAVYIESNKLKRAVCSKTDVGTLVQALTKVAHSSADVLKCFDSILDSKLFKWGTHLISPIHVSVSYLYTASKISRTPPLLAGLSRPDERPPPQLAPVVREWFVEISHHDQVYIQVIHLWANFDSNFNLCLI